MMLSIQAVRLDVLPHPVPEGIPSNNEDGRRGRRIRPHAQGPVNKWSWPLPLLLWYHTASVMAKVREMNEEAHAQVVSATTPALEVEGSSPELSLAIPLYNEENNVRLVVSELVRALEEAGVDYELVLVDNGSTDTTGKIVDELARKNSRLTPVHVPVNQGYGWGIISGLRQCRGRYLGYAWGDNQVRAEDVVRIFQHLKSGDVDMAKSKRVQRYDGLQRLIITRIYNTVFPFFFPVHSEDVNGCPKIFTREAYEAIQPQSKDWFLDPEIMIKAHRLGLRIVEVPVIFYPRPSGKSKVRWQTVLEFIRNMIRYRLQGEL